MRTTIKLILILLLVFTCKKEAEPNELEQLCFLLVGAKEEREGTFSLELKQSVNNKIYIEAYRSQYSNSEKFYFFSEDQGDSWQKYSEQVLPLGQSFSANLAQGETPFEIEYSSGGIGWLVSHVNYSVIFIRKTSDSGATWVLQKKIVMESFYGNLKIINTNEIVVFVSPNSIFRTLDGGVNWSQSFLDSSYEFQSMKIYSSGVGFIQGNKPYPNEPDHILLETKDNGVSWTKIKNLVGFYDSFLQLNEQVILHTEKENLYRTEDSAKTWIKLDNGFAKYTYLDRKFPQLPCQF